VVRRVLLALASVAFTLVLAEIAVRLVWMPPAGVRHLVFPPSFVNEMHPARGVMPGIEYEISRFTTNRIGLRGEALPADDRPRVLSVGGSTTEVLYVDDSDAWPRVLAERLSGQGGDRWWSGNAGRSGLRLDDHLVYMHFLLPKISPRLVVVMVGINDLTACLDPRHREEASRDLVLSADYAERRAQRVFWEVHGEGQPALGVLVGRLSSKGVAPDVVVQDKSGAFYAERRARRAGAERQREPADVSRCLRGFRQRLLLGAEVARAHDAELVYATQPSLYRDDLSADEEALLWLGAVEADVFSDPPPARYYAAAAMKTMLDAYNDVTREVCAAKKLRCVDLASLVPSSTASFYDDVHFNRAGSRLVGELLGERLGERPAD
jgi:lysophospholipase L1-like esterase